MRGAVYHNRRDIRVEDVPEPIVKEGEVVVDVEWSGICGSELHEYTMGPLLIKRSNMPLVLGHEFCGRVAAAPPGSRLQKGEAVMVDPRILCGSCYACHHGDARSCGSFGYVGGTTGGGFGERVAVAESAVHPLGPNIPIEYAAVIEPLAVVHHAVKEAGIADWSTQNVLILGGGPIGYALLIDLIAHGAKNIIVSEPAQARREQMAEYAQTVIDPIKENVGHRCRTLTEGKGVDVVFDCAGVPVGLEAGVDALKYAGLMVIVAVYEKPMAVPCWKFLMKHLTIKGVVIFSGEDFREVMQWIAEGRIIGYEKMVTGRINVDDIVEKGFEELVNNKDKHIKILVSPKNAVAVEG